MAADPQPDSEALLQLARELRSGQADAPAKLNELFRASLLRFCWGYLGNMDEAEDALQEIIYKVMTATQIPDQLRPWLYRVARNHCLNRVRDRARRRDHAGMPPESVLGETLTGQLTRLARDETKVKVAELVRQLPETMREVLRMRYVDNLSRGEIAAVLEISESAVKSRLFEGLKRLRELSAGLGDSPA